MSEQLSSKSEHVAPVEPVPSELAANLWEGFNKIKTHGGDARDACIYLAGLYSEKDSAAADLFAAIANVSRPDF